ncbi:AzlD domain-containing protein [Microvirga sp. W0021]|uniref:AzlD domain-containing protein n=1 Tax=Hohaiivirga grylli TaxID=3133970 RepID=A0ABV0BLY1_9HYPH
MWQLDSTTLLVIIGMTIVTYGTRLSGLLLAGHLKLSRRGRTALNAIPAAVLVSVIAPTALATGWAETLAAIVTIFAALRLPVLATIGIGVASVVVFRMLLG